MARRKEAILQESLTNQENALNKLKLLALIVKRNYFNLGAAGAGDLRGLQAVTKTLHLVLKLFFSEFEFKK